ncbi:MULTISPECIES: hypothetical protein [Dyadobacter]|jgi:hypothetical protein|uniref:Uncharacterized protein n=1 Tax=Dyadobacter chenhuakuii TaxID=2909339 RepID=A0A9X1TZV4_9BACT|nr:MULTISPECIES: hypothetical protein [Dyadobacter]MCE7072489.1 hypothetical protein [Dyadobacter sp. CY327]MCF2497636.1 hypothetical protein [Dyadobacter chenhuakuii]
MMSYTDRHIVKTYSGLFEGLSSSGKRELIESLTKSLDTESNEKDEKFFKSFGAFSAEKSPEEIAAEIKASRKFRKKDLGF